MRAACKYRFSNWLPDVPRAGGDAGSIRAVRRQDEGKQLVQAADGGVRAEILRFRFPADLDRAAAGVFRRGDVQLFVPYKNEPGGLDRKSVG